MKNLVFIFLLTTSSLFIQAQKSFEVNIGELGAKIQPDMYGVFFEDINFGADGGLYAELIKNRSFEFDQPFVEKPNTVIPVRSFVNADSDGFTLKASGNAFYVCKLKIQKSRK